MRHRHHIGHYHTLYTLCIVGFIFALHYTLPSYINSSFLETITTEKTVSLLYMIASIASIVGYLFFHKIIRIFKTYPTMIVLTIVQIGVLYGLTVTKDPLIIGALFIGNLLLVSLIGFIVDILVESCSTHSNTGRMWGFYYTAFNFGWILGPLIGSSLISNGNDYQYIYIAAAGILVPLVYIIHKNFKNFHDVRYSSLSFKDTWTRIIANKDLRKIFVINVFLNTFYAWMIIYTPPYLHKTLGFSWDDIGLMFTVMLTPFILLEIPLGRLADRKWGEKELMIGGFVIMALSTAALAFIPQHSLVWWAFMLFMTRVGAATAELMIETYFFKHIRQKDANMLSMFRVTRPLSTFIAPLIMTTALMFVSHQLSFVVLGVLLVFSLIFCVRIKDTN
ncbi:MAG: MFS transporter [Patescibacteria group bacterium]